MSVDLTPSLVVVMAGYAKGMHLGKIALRWIKALCAISSKLVLVYDQDQLHSVPEWCQSSSDVEILLERHGAYDFGSYGRGLRLAEQRGWLQDATHVLLCNDSLIGPFWDFDDFIRPMLLSGDPLWGIADSYLYRPHLQSYFILMGRELFTAPSIRRFFDDVIPQPSRHDVIQAYELGFSKLVCQQGFSWKTFLPMDQMLDPRNGELMGNVTAYPVCMLQKGVPLIKVKSLTDPRSNYDGLAQTCAYLALNYPDIWKDLWDEYDCQSMWQSQVSIGILLSPKDLPLLNDRLAWMQSHPHATIKAIIAIERNAIETRAALMNRFEDALKDNSLSILLVDNTKDLRPCLIKMLAAVGTDWVVLSQNKLWGFPAALQLQTRQIAEKPDRDTIDGWLKLWNQTYCLTEAGVSEFMRDALTFAKVE